MFQDHGYHTLMVFSLPHTAHGISCSASPWTWSGSIHILLIPAADSQRYLMLGQMQGASKAFFFFCRVSDLQLLYWSEPGSSPFFDEHAWWERNRGAVNIPQSLHIALNWQSLFDLFLLGLKLGKSPKKAVAKANGRKNSSALGAEDFKMLK